MKKDTNESFDAKLVSKGIKHLRVGEYKNSYTKILFKCYECSNTWNSSPVHILHHNIKCPVCAGNKAYTNISLDKVMLSKGIKYTRVGNCTNSSTKIDFKCFKCAEIFNTTPSSILRGYGCPKCAKWNTFNINDIKIDTLKLYLVKFNNFLKVGLTSNSLDTRLSRIGTYIPIIELDGLAIDMFNLEQSIHNNKKLVKYIPSIKFSGYTECYTLEMESILIDTIYNGK